MSLIQDILDVYSRAYIEAGRRPQWVEMHPDVLEQLGSEVQARGLCDQRLDRIFGMQICASLAVAGWRIGVHDGAHDAPAQATFFEPIASNTRRRRPLHYGGRALHSGNLVTLTPPGDLSQHHDMPTPEIDYETLVDDGPSIEEMWAKMAALGVKRDE